MVAAALLLGLLLVASFTDVRWRKIFNWTTYPGILIALVGSGLATLLGVEAAGERAADSLCGFVNFPDSVAGLLSCGAAMLVCYVFFPGGIGGGDVKLIAMIGAFLGVRAGLEAMLWTFVLGGCAALIMLVWRVGLWTLLAGGAKYLLLTLRVRQPVPLTEEGRKPLKTELFLSPSALAAVIVVHFVYPVVA
jgi:prepilin peptidase CpaA